MSVTFSMAEYHEEQGRTVLWQLDDEQFDVNVSNANAYALLERLGLDTTVLLGEATPDDLLGRALVGNVGRDDSGVDAVETPGEWFGGGATMIDCGRRDGYFEDRMTALVALATEAQNRQVMVMWA